VRSQYDATPLSDALACEIRQSLDNISNGRMAAE
jgi:hypothetical protein